MAQEITKAIPVREQVMKLVALTTGQRQALVEVCTATEFGKDRCCWMNNHALGERIGCHKITASRYVRELQALGLVVSSLELMGQNKRALMPSNEVRSVYTGGNWVNSLFTLNNLITLNNGTVYPKQSDAKGKQSDYHNISLIKKENNLLHVEVGNAAADAANQGLQIRISGLAAELKAFKVMVEEHQAHLAAYARAAACQSEADLVDCWNGLAAPPLKDSDLQQFFAKRKLEIKNAAAYAQEISALKTQPLALVPAAKPAKPAKAKATACLMSESFYALVAPFKDALAGTDYAHADLDYYHEVIFNWSLSKAEKRADWIATAKGWMLRDSKRNELKTNPNSQAASNGNTSQHQRDHQQRHGLIDADRLAKSLEFHRAMGL